jgi:GTPase
MSEKRCGYVAIVGRPNVGKSTLLNAILGQKLSITSRKRQTTRHAIHGIKTENNTQVVYIDTPGIHADRKTILNRQMNKAALSSMYDVSVIVFVVDANYWSEEDDAVLASVKEKDIPVILVANKIDELKEKEALLPTLQDLAEKFDFAALVPVSAKQKTNIKELEAAILKYMPEGEHMFDETQLTDRNDQFLMEEVIREKLFHNAHQEIPYATTVVVDEIKKKKGILHISATIYVEKQGQKAIVIGKNGELMKQIGRQARLDLEAMYGTKVFLQLWVKVKEGWTNNEKMMNDFFLKKDE